MILCYSCALFIASRFGGLGILHLVLYLYCPRNHISFSLSRHFLFLDRDFFLQEKITDLFAIFHIFIGQLKPEQICAQVFKLSPANKTFCWVLSVSKYPDLSLLLKTCPQLWTQTHTNAFAVGLGLYAGSQLNQAVQEQLGNAPSLRTGLCLQSHGHPSCLSRLPEEWVTA